MRLPTLFLALLLLPGCAEFSLFGSAEQPDELEDTLEAMSGRWKVTDYETYQENCQAGPGSPQARTGEFDEFELAGGVSALDQTTPELEIRSCTARGGCEREALEIEGFTKAEDLGWVYQLANAYPTPYNTCQATLRRALAVPTEKGVRVETYAYSGELTLEGEVRCQDATVVEHLEELECVRKEVIEAKRTGGEA